METGATPMSQDPGERRAEEVRGMKVACRLHLFQFLFLAIIAVVSRQKSLGVNLLTALVLLPLSEWLYLGPAMLREYRANRPLRAKGIRTCGLISAVLALCAAPIVFFMLCAQMLR